jgi:ABC-type glycerol-3-phosphate transport system permease component
MASSAEAAVPLARRRVRVGRLVGEVALYATCLLLCVLTIFPFLWMLSTSFKVPGDELVWPPQWLPSPFTTENYTELFSRSMTRNFPFPTFIWHSTYIALVNVVGRVAVCAMGGYAFARLRFPGSKYAFGMLIAALLLPDVVQVIPLYSLYNQIGWLDTHWPLIMPGVFANTFGTFLFRQFFMTLPQELDDAARIDGASHFQIFWKIALPLARPVMAALAIFTFQGSWNNVQTPVFYITSLRNQTLPVGLLAFNQQYGVQYSLLMAGSMIALVPVLLVFMFFQRYFVQGIALTGLKG